jgi:hypothetical protein
MTKEEFIAWAATKGLMRNRFDGFHPPNVQGKRYKLAKNSVRYEVKTEGGLWVRIRSNYLKHISISPDGRLRGLVP